MTERTMNVETVQPPPMESRVVLTGTNLGDRSLLENGGAFATDGDDQVAKIARYVAQFQAGTLSVAWIGGGLCIGPGIVAFSGITQTVYEIRPYLREFCPEGVTFIPGDWRDTISGKFDVIVYDLGGDVPYVTLAQYLTPSGLVLPKEA